MIHKLTSEVCTYVHVYMYIHMTYISLCVKSQCDLIPYIGGLNYCKVPHTLNFSHMRKCMQSMY